VWILRYVYKPLGGNRRKALLLLPVFVFVGIWHVDYQLLAWSLANAVGFGVEVYALTLVEKYKITSRLAEAAGGTLALLGLVCANLFITGPVLATRLIGGMYFNTADWLSSLGVWAFCVLFFSCLILHSHTRDRLLLLRPPPDRTHPAHFLAIDPFSKKK
jgi:D-alanyl-lipoteichoic acid acyltransferase DltB (MBOAT superfamily)